MISSLSTVLTGIEQPNGSSIANAMGFTDNDDGGDIVAKFGQVEVYDEDTGDISYEGYNDAYYAVRLTGGTTYTLSSSYSGFSLWGDGPSVRFEDSSGSQVGTAITVEELEDDPWMQVVPGSFTPSSTDVYYLHAYLGEYAMGGSYEIPLNISPRPNEYSCVTRRLWDAYPWERKNRTGMVKSKVSGIPSAVLVMPLLNSETPTVNTASATTERNEGNPQNGVITFDGTGLSVQGNTDQGIAVSIPTVFAGSWTAAIAFCLSGSENENGRRVIGLRNMSAFDTGNSDGDFKVEIQDSNTCYLKMFNQGYLRFAKRPSIKAGTWHTAIFCFDRDAKEMRGAIDGTGFGTYQFMPYQVEAGMFKSTGQIHLGGIYPDASNPIYGKVKNFQVFATALDFNQMRYLSSKLLS